MENTFTFHCLGIAGLTRNITIIDHDVDDDEDWFYFDEEEYLKEIISCEDSWDDGIYILKCEINSYESFTEWGLEYNEICFITDEILLSTLDEINKSSIKNWKNKIEGV